MTKPKGPAIEPVRRLNVSAAAAAELERMINNGDYELGEKLPPQRILAEQLGIGHGSMREALRLLEANGFIRIDHGVGTFVVRSAHQPPAGRLDLLVIDGVTIIQLLEVRRALEAEAARLAARRLTLSEAAELERIFADSADPGLSDRDFVEREANLHRAIARATKNPLIVQLVQGLEPLFLSYAERVIQLPGRRALAHAGHERIVSAIVARRSRDARNAVVMHLRAVENDVVTYLERSADQTS